MRFMPFAFLSRGRIQEMLAQQRTPVDWMVACVAEWITRGGPILGKPTSFQTRDGRF